MCGVWRKALTNHSAARSGQRLSGTRQDEAGSSSCIVDSKMNSLLSVNELSNMTASSSVSMSGLSVTSTQFQDQDDKTGKLHWNA